MVNNKQKSVPASKHLPDREEKLQDALKDNLARRKKIRLSQAEKNPEDT